MSKRSNRPGLRQRIEEIVGIADNTGGEAVTAEEAEERAISAVRRLGQEVLREWSSSRLSEVNADYEKRKDFEREVKKNSTGARSLAQQFWNH